MEKSETIAGFPDDEFETSLQAIEAAFRLIVSPASAGKIFWLSGQSYEADGEQYSMRDALYQDGVFEFKVAVPDAAAALRSVGISAERTQISEAGRVIAIEGGTVAELSRFLDHVYRHVYKIKPLPGGDNYNFCADIIPYRY